MNGDRCGLTAVVIQIRDGGGTITQTRLVRRLILRVRPVLQNITGIIVGGRQ